MNAAADVLAREPASPAFDIVRAAYGELLVTDLEESRHFYADVLGLVVRDSSDDVLYLGGWEERSHHSIVLRKAASPAVRGLGLRVRAESDLGLLRSEFERRGCRAELGASDLIGMNQVLHVQDPFGFPLQFFSDMARVPSQLQRFDVQRGAPVMRLDHFNLHVPRLESTLQFWRELGFRCSEYISTDGPDERITGAWLYRKPAVHDVALTAGHGPRLHHLGLFVAEPAGILRACDQIAAAGYARSIERGPGRHGVSNAFFVYLRDPDGHRIELYASDYYTGDPDHEPLRWSVSDPSCRSFWGAHAPDSWYDESSNLIGIDGKVVATEDAGVDERVARSDLMA